MGLGPTCRRLLSLDIYSILSTAIVSDVNDYHQIISNKESHHILTTFIKYTQGKVKNIMDEVDGTNNGEPVYWVTHSYIMRQEAEPTSV